MIIALLIALGVSAGGILLLLIALTLVKRFKTIKHPAVFKTRVRLIEGQFPGVSGQWKKGYGAWVANVLTVRKGIALNIADVLPVAELGPIRSAAPADVAGLGEAPIIGALTLSTGAKLEVAVAVERRAVGLDPWEAEGGRPAVPAKAIHTQVDRSTISEL